MLYSRGQQFVATLLLFSILLQSCGNPPTTNSTRGQQRTESPRRSSNAPDDVAALSKQAYFYWKEQEEIRIAKEAKERAKQLYFSRWQRQEPSRRAETRKQKLDETYRREERRRQEEPRREQEERRARLDETYRREEQRRKREEVAREAEVMSAAACAQDEEDDTIEEIYTDYRAMPSETSPPSADPSASNSLLSRHALGGEVCKVGLGTKGER